MPTLARLVAAILLAATGFVAAELYRPHLPESVEATWLSATVAALGLIIGWRAVGRGAEAPHAGVLVLAAKAAIYLLFWTLLVFGIREMLNRSFRRAYDDPFTAVLDIPAIGWDYLVSAAVPEVMGALLLGALITGAATRFVARRYGTL